MTDAGVLAATLVMGALAGGGWGASGPIAPAFGSSGAAASVSQVDSLLTAARRAAEAWRQHDFGALFAAGVEVRMQLPGAEPSGPLRAGQAAELLRAFVEGDLEQSAQLLVVRRVDADRAYVELQREFMVRGTAARRLQTLYLGMRRDGPGYRLVELRVVP